MAMVTGNWACVKKWCLNYRIIIKRGGSGHEGVSFLFGQQEVIVVILKKSANEIVKYYYNTKKPIYLFWNVNKNGIMRVGSWLEKRVFDLALLRPCNCKPYPIFERLEVKWMCIFARAHTHEIMWALTSYVLWYRILNLNEACMIHDYEHGCMCEVRWRIQNIY